MLWSLQSLENKYLYYNIYIFIILYRACGTTTTISTIVLGLLIVPLHDMSYAQHASSDQIDPIIMLRETGRLFSKENLRIPEKNEGSEFVIEKNKRSAPRSRLLCAEKRTLLCRSKH